MKIIFSPETSKSTWKIFSNILPLIAVSDLQQSYHKIVKNSIVKELKLQAGKIHHYLRIVLYKRQEQQGFLHFSSKTTKKSNIILLKLDPVRSMACFLKG